METNENYIEPATPAPRLELTHSAMVDLLEARKWAHLIAIIGFIGLGLVVIVGLLAGVLFSTLMGGSDLPFSAGIIGLIYVGMAVVYIFPLLYLYRFAKSAQKAVLYQNSNELNVAIKNLRSHYQYMGILMLVIIAIYFLVIVVSSMNLF